jgi:superfamily II DNA or RNA helicase
MSIESPPLERVLPSSSFLEWAFLRWVLGPAVRPGIAELVVPQAEVDVNGRHYRLDYEFRGSLVTLAVELDGFEFHGNRQAFTYDRLRQNDLTATGRQVIRFSYDAIRLEVHRCVEQLRAVLALDPLLAPYLIDNPDIQVPQMDPDPLHALSASPAQHETSPATYFDTIRGRIDQRPLRQCQREAFAALANYYAAGEGSAACVMSVGAGKTALGVVATLAFTRRRALVVTPGSVIRGTFDRAFDHQAVGNVLYTLPGGAVLPGCRPPAVRTLDREEGAIRHVTREELLGTDVIITNFHSLGTGEEEGDLLSKLEPADIDFIVVDEAHIAAADSYQRLFRHFSGVRTLLMSACFQRLDGRPIDADVVYRYRLIDSIADGNAKNLRVHRFEPDPTATIYEMVWPDGFREEIVGRDALLEIVDDERKLSRITAKSTAPIRQVMRTVKECLDVQAEVLYPIKPRVLFSAMGERHAEQVVRIAEECGIPSAHLHHSMTDGQIKSVRDRYESDSGDLQGIVQLKMLGQGYDFPPISVVVPLRPYSSFSEFYQFMGRGIRVILHPSLTGRVGPEQQFLDVICHAELGLDDHIGTIYRENDMDPSTVHLIDSGAHRVGAADLPGTHGHDVAERPETYVIFERGAIDARVVHDQERVEARRAERELEAMAQRYSEYAGSTTDPVSFQQYVAVLRNLNAG